MLRLWYYYGAILHTKSMPKASKTRTGMYSCAVEGRKHKNLLSFSWNWPQKEDKSSFYTDSEFDNWGRYLCLMVLWKPWYPVVWSRLVTVNTCVDAHCRARQFSFPHHEATKEESEFPVDGFWVNLEGVSSSVIYKATSLNWQKEGIWKTSAGVKGHSVP